MAKDPLSVESWWGRIHPCRKVRKDKLRTWRDSVSYRRGRPFRSTPAEDTVNVPSDWSRTKNKASQLWFQVPEFVLIARHPKWAPVAPVFAAAVNFELQEKIHLEHVMNECLADVINAAGVMIAYVSYDASFENVALDVAPQAPPQMPGAIPPQMGGGQPQLGGAAPMVGMPPAQAAVPNVMQQAIAGAGQQPPQQEMVPRPVYQCFDCARVSPAHFLWPLEFVGSNWRKAPWLGREGYLSVAEAVRRKWVPEGTEGVQITDEDWYLVNDFADTKPADSYIKFCELFYYPYYFDPDEKDPRKIKRIVLVETKDGPNDEKPAVHEDFSWQKQTPEGRWVGMTSLPLIVGTLTHISDMAIPPSDSEIARPQVRELIKLRSLLMRQRDHSIPMRWFDVNLVDPMVAVKLRAGKWQDIIPMNGPGDKALGEVARASYPPENWQMDRVIKQDLDESWSMGAMQQGITTPGETTATEVKEISGANDLRLELERSWVMRFNTEIAQAVGSLMQMFADESEYALVVGDDGKQALQQWSKDTIPGDYLWKYKPDSQLKLDVQQRRNEGLQLYKLLRKEPLINPMLLVRRVLEDHGLDWSKMIVPPQEPKKAPPKISASFKGEDLISPMAVALINKSDAKISDQDIADAKKLIEASSMTTPPAPVPGAPGQPPPANPGHPGPADVVQPIDRRYEQGGDHGIEGSRDSGMPTPPQQ